jgi:hypothetical protein
MHFDRVLGNDRRFAPWQPRLFPEKYRMSADRAPQKLLP